MIEAGLAALSFLKSFAPWIVAGVSTLAAFAYRSTAKRHKIDKETAEEKAQRAQAIADHSHELATRLFELDKEQEDEKRQTIERLAAVRDYFDRD